MRTHYVSELGAVRKNLVEMGETTASLLAEALQAVVEPNRGPSERASELEAQTDHQHRLIHDRWRTGNRAQALSVRSHETAIRAECGNLYEKLSRLVSSPGTPCVWRIKPPNRLTAT